MKGEEHYCSYVIMSNKFNKIINNVGKNAKDILDKSKDMIVQVADQDDDGKLGLNDLSLIADNIQSLAKQGASNFKEQAQDMAKELELKRLQPIFQETLTDAGFVLSKFIRIVERDKKRMDSEVCQGSIGYASDYKGMHMINVYYDSVDNFNIKFYPDSNSEFYYVDPVDRDLYISINDYFNYLKVVRISELQKLAQELGAKHFKVTYKEEARTFTNKKLKIGVGVGYNGKYDSTKDLETKSFSTVEVAAENDFEGHAPTQPSLVYLKHDIGIKNLIEMRFNEQSKMKNHRFTVKLINSSGMKESDAVKIDAVLEGLKCGGNCSLVSEVQSESRRYLDYEINF